MNKQWETSDEIRFIRRLEPRKLEKYYTALWYRSNWNGMDREAVVKECRKQLGLEAHE